MDYPQQIFHLAIPTHDLEKSTEYYVTQLGCRLARTYSDRITLDFFSHQLVCHLAPDSIELKPKMYPRHFGMTLRDRNDFDAIYERAKRNKLIFFQERFERFPKTEDAHESFFLQDPSNNLIEFKYYYDPKKMY